MDSGRWRALVGVSVVVGSACQQKGQGLWESSFPLISAVNKIALKNQVYRKQALVLQFPGKLGSTAPFTT